MLSTYMSLPYPYNLWSTIHQTEINQEELPQDWEAALDYAIVSMPHRLAKETLLLYFREGSTLKEIGTKYGMTVTAVEHKIDQTIQKMRKPYLANFIRHGLDKGHEMNTVLRTDEALMANASVEYLNLSARAMNCLRRAKIHTIGQLKECSDEDLFKVRNLGEGTLCEIKQALAKFKDPYVADTAAEPVDTQACTIRTRLISDLSDSRTERIKNQKWASDERIADYLLSKGWTLPSCNENGNHENPKE